MDAAALTLLGLESTLHFSFLLLKSRYGLFAQGFAHTLGQPCRVRLYAIYPHFVKGVWAEFFAPLEFYNRDKGRKALNLTEKYKKQESWQERKQAQRKESKKMLYQVIGVERKTGDFTPRDGSNRQIHYDNLVLHSVTLKRLVGCAGQKAEQCSIKVVDSADLLESVGAMDDISKVIGHQFDFETSYGKIKSWELVK